MWRKEWPTDKHFHYLTTNPSQKHSFVLNIYKTEINYRVTKKQLGKIRYNEREEIVGVL